MQAPNVATAAAATPANEIAATVDADNHVSYLMPFATYDHVDDRRL